MQTCYNCGKVVEDSVLICPECGALVKRYGAPVSQTDPADETGAPQVFAADTGTADASMPVHKDENGKIRLRKSVSVWLVLCIIAALYTAFSLAATLYVYNHQDVFLTPFLAIEEYASLTETIQYAMGMIDMMHPLFVGLAIFFAAKGAAIIWFLASKKRLALRIAIAVSCAVSFFLLTTGNGFGSLIYCADMIVTWIWLRKGLHLLN